MKRLGTIDRIVIVGCGGTGSWLSLFICRMLASNKSFKGTIWFVDGDSYDEGNSSRQEFASVLVGFNKAEAQCAMMGKKFPALEDNLQYFDEYIGEDNIGEVIGNNTVVFNCVDNHAARFYIDRHVGELTNAIHICGGNEHHDGQVQMHMVYDGSSITRPIDKEFPDMFQDISGDRSKMTCDELSDLPGGGQIIAANISSASLMLNFFVSAMIQDIWSTDCVLFDVHTVGFDRRGKIVGV